MRFGNLNPWQVLHQLREEMDRSLSGVPTTRPGAFPPVNVWSNPEGVVVTAEIPGVDPATLEITAVRDGISIRGERLTTAREEGMTWHRRERRSGAFHRTIELPYTIDAESVDASCRDGVLRIAFKRPEEDKPRRIEIASA